MKKIIYICDLCGAEITDTVRAVNIKIPLADGFDARYDFDEMCLHCRIELDNRIQDFIDSKQIEE